METVPRTSLLRVDLSTGTIDRERVPDRWRERYIGGKGLGARYLYDELDAGVDPLGADNVVLVLLGPLTGLLPGDTKCAIVTKSPLTGTFVDSYIGGRFPERLAGALDGAIGILVTGRAEEPVRLDLGPSGPALTSAASLWGADTVTTCESFSDATVACIGPAGEQSVRYATVATEAGDHQAGRGGIGTVLGAKRLKAIVVESDPPASITDPPADIASLRREYADRIESDGRGQWHTASETLETIDFAHEVGALPTRGWQEGQFEGAADIGIEAVRNAATERERADADVPGGFRFETDEEETVPRGSTMMTLGAGLGISDFEEVLSLGSHCDRLGMDVITAGSVVAWAMLASEYGIIDRDLTFGDTDGATALLTEIVEGDTDLATALGAGVDAATAAFDSDELIPTVKGMELPSYDPRGSPAMALAYATSDRGACHRRSRPVEREVFADEFWTPGKCARDVIHQQHGSSVLWSLIVDDLLASVFVEDLGAEWLQRIGLDYDEADLRRAGERIWTLTRLFNVREGFDRADDELPVTLTEPLPDGPKAGNTVDSERFQRMCEAYYEYRDWDDDGVPRATLLRRLGLLGVVDEETPVGLRPSESVS